MQDIEKLKTKIDEVKVVSFDIFDTLLFRIVDRPIAIFEILEEYFQIRNFSQMRQDFQRQASEKVMRENGYPHANFDEIYDFMGRHTTFKVSIEEIKKKEIELEGASLYPNAEMQDIFLYAKEKGKKIILTTDMYFDSKTLTSFLKQNCYTGYSFLYDSADVRKAKFDGTLFSYVIQKEGVKPEEILHIGDHYKDDILNASSLGIQTFHYQSEQYIEKSSLTDFLTSFSNGMLKKILLEEKISKNDFWKILGYRVGGPIYLKLYDFLRQAQKKNTPCFFLARDGYNLWKIDQKEKKINGSYLYTSRRALLLAGIKKIDETTLSYLPPFAFGQTVQEILDYLDFSLTLEEVKKVGFQSLDDVILTFDDMDRFKQIYVLYQKQFLSHCETERKHALSYFKKTGLFQTDATLFDCGWQGSSQYLLENFLKQNGYQHSIQFCYTGIFDNEKSRKQLMDRSYISCFFDKEHMYPEILEIQKSIVLAELFFGAPHGSVWKYDKDGYILEDIEDNMDYKQDILFGIQLFLDETMDFFQKFLKNADAKYFFNPLYELVIHPTLEEAKTIGNIGNVDGFTHQKHKKKYIAYLTKEDFLENPLVDIYWKNGLLKRDDISSYVKNRVSGNHTIKSFARKTPVYKVYRKTLERMYSEGLRAFFFRKSRGAVRRLTLPGSLYQKWIKINESNISSVCRNFTYQPLISIVVPVYNVLSNQLEECIDSVLSQTYQNFELIMVDDCSSMESVRETLKEYEDNPKIKISYHTKNERISKTTNDCIQLSSGEFIAFLDCDDVLSKNALEEVVLKLNEDPSFDFIYSDEDKLSEDGKYRHDPFFKPDWSIDTFLSLMYTCHFSVYRKSIVDKIGGLTVGLDGAQDYDFTLRFVEETTHIAHIPKILYHWRERPESIASNPEAKPYALNAIKNLKEEYLKRHHLVGTVEYEPSVYQYRIVYQEKKNSLVSIIIPSKDHPEVLETCVRSIRDLTDYKNFEILVIDNGSSKEKKKEYEELSKQYQFQYIYEKFEFNFSRMCNMGAKLASGKYFLFLNDDMEIIHSSWLSILVGHASLDHAGAVGAKLYYPNSLQIQHDGIVNLRHGPSHVLMGMDDSKLYYYCNNRLDYNYLAVTGACLMVSKEKFYEVDGFDEKLPVAYNDVDFCFKLYEKGYFNVVRNDVKLYHYESFSRGVDTMSKEKVKRLRLEKNYLYLKHPNLLGRDPFYNSNLDQTNIDFRIDTNQKSRCKIEEITEDIKRVGDEFSYSLEKLGIVNGTLKIYGYALDENISKNNSNEIILYLKSSHKTYRIKPKKLYRDDLSYMYQTHCHLCGFYVICDLSFVEPSEYEVYIELRNKKAKKKAILNTEFKVKVL